jgi:hypothetical protein
MAHWPGTSNSQEGEINRVPSEATSAIARMDANGDAHGNHGLFLPLITRINADWM